MKYLVFMISFSALFLSCEKSQKNEFISTSVDIYVQNAIGEDLLESTYLSSFIKLFYEIDNEKVEVYNENLDAPRGIKIVEIEGTQALRVTLNTSDNDYPITYIEWNEFDTDTIRNNYTKTDDGLVFRLDTLWYNGERMLPDQFFGPTLGFRIVK